MIIIFLCTAVYLFFILIDVIPIVKSKQWKALSIYAGLITAAYVLTVMYELGIQVPSPAASIKQLITSIIGK